MRGGIELRFEHDRSRKANSMRVTLLYRFCAAALSAGIAITGLAALSTSLEHDDTTIQALGTCAKWRTHPWCRS